MPVRNVENLILLPFGTQVDYISLPVGKWQERFSLQPYPGYTIVACQLIYFPTYPYSLTIRASLSPEPPVVP
ncbi:hypothetical protein ACX0G7_26155, partial [Flavitalea antarctica]